MPPPRASRSCSSCSAKGEENEGEEMGVGERRRWTGGDRWVDSDERTVGGRGEG